MCRPALSRGQKLAHHGRMRATVNIQVTCSRTAYAKAEEELKDSSTKDCFTFSCFTMSFQGTPFGLPYGLPFSAEDQQYMNALATGHHPTYLPPLQYYTSVPPPPPYPIYPQPLPQLHPFSPLLHQRVIQYIPFPARLRSYLMYSNLLHQHRTAIQ